MAEAAGISATSVRRIWKAHGLKPHLAIPRSLYTDISFMDEHG